MQARLVLPELELSNVASHIFRDVKTSPLLFEEARLLGLLLNIPSLQYRGMRMSKLRYPPKIPLTAILERSSQHSGNLSGSVTRIMS